MNTPDSSGGSSTTSTTSTSTNSSSGTLVPGWVFNPRSKIIGIVTGWIVAGFLAFNREVVGMISTFFDTYRDAIDVSFAGISGVFREAGRGLLDVILTLNLTLADLAGASGFAGPLAAAATFVLVALATATAIAAGKKVILWVT